MIILEKTVNFFLKEKVQLKAVSVLMNRAGVINAYDDVRKAVKVEVPTIRPDLNCILGVLIEISALTENCFSDFNYLTLESYMDKWDISSDVPVFISSMNGNQIQEFPLEIQETLALNQLSTGDRFRDLSNFCALFFGVPLMIVSENKLGNRIMIKENRIYGYETLEWGEDNIDFQMDSICLLALLADPAKVKASFDRKKKKADGLYYYYIRRGNARFISAFFQFMKMPFQKYPVQKKENFVLFDYTQIEDIVGLQIGRERSNQILQRLGYRLEGKMAFLPEWRTDISGCQEMAQDILRIYLAVMDNEASLNEDSAFRSDYNDYLAMMEQKMYYANYGFTEVMSRPFIDRQELSEIRSYLGTDFEVITLLNPMNKNKNIILPSLLVKLKKNLGKENRIFEMSQIKFIKRGEMVEKNVIGAAGKYNNGDSIYAIVSDLWMFTSGKYNCICVSEKNESFCIWKMISRDRTVGTIVIYHEEKNKVVILMEKDVYGIEDNCLSLRREDNTVLQRELSIDLPVICPFFELENHFFDNKKEIIHDFRIKESRLFRKNDVWMVNYQVQILWKDIRKTDLPEYNRQITEVVKRLKSIYAV